MIPTLYSKNTTLFDGPNTQDCIGYLSDAMSCVVTEEINGEYSLTMTYRYDGVHFNDLVIGNYILATHDDDGDWQPFRIERVTANLDGTAEIYAPHFSIWLTRISVFPYAATSCAVAVANISLNLMTQDYGSLFTFSTDIVSGVDYQSKIPRTIRGLLAGEEGSIVDCYGQGELYFDVRSVQLLQRRGADRGVTLRHGKNLTKIKYDDNSGGKYNAIVPYWRDPYTGIRVLAATGSTMSNYIVSDGNPYEVALPVDVTNRISLAEGVTYPTTSQVAAAGASWLASNKPYDSDPSISISFDPAWRDGNVGGKILLGDTVTVEDRRFRVNNRYLGGQFRVQKTVFDTLRERYQSVEIGKLPPSLYKTIRNIAKS